MASLQCSSSRLARKHNIHHTQSFSCMIGRLNPSPLRPCFRRRPQLQTSSLLSASPVLARVQAGAAPLLKPNSTRDEDSVTFSFGGWQELLRHSANAALAVALVLGPADPAMAARSGGRAGGRSFSSSRSFSSRGYSSSRSSASFSGGRSSRSSASRGNSTSRGSTARRGSSTGGGGAKRGGSSRPESLSRPASRTSSSGINSSSSSSSPTTIINSSSYSSYSPPPYSSTHINVYDSTYNTAGPPVSSSNSSSSSSATTINTNPSPADSCSNSSGIVANADGSATCYCAEREDDLYEDYHDYLGPDTPTAVRYICVLYTLIIWFFVVVYYLRAI